MCSRKQFEKLFAEGTSFLVYPLKIIVLETVFESRYPARAAFAVSKRNFKKAVSRNRLKRKMREGYRLNKQELYAQLPDKKLILAFVYIAKEDLPYQQITAAIKKGISLIPQKLAAGQPSNQNRD